MNRAILVGPRAGRRRPRTFIQRVRALMIGVVLAAGAGGRTVPLLAADAPAKPAKPAAKPAPKLKPSMNAYFPQHFTDATYQRAAVDKVLKNWAPPSPRPGADKKTVVQSTIGKDGKLAGAVVTMKTGMKEWDDACLRAVQKASPFPAFPKGFSHPTIEVHWHFAMNP